MGVKERREREKIATRDIILDAARELFATEGYEGVTMRMVAEKIEYSPTAIYVHFKDKEELFRQVCHADFARLAEVFQEHATVSDPVELLKAIGRTYAQFGTNFPNHYRLMFMTPHPLSDLDPLDIEIKDNPEVDAYAFLTRSVRQAIDAGIFRDDLNDADLIAQTLWASIHGVISLNLAKEFDPWVNWRPLEQRVELVLDAVLRGMLREVK